MGWQGHIKLKYDLLNSTWAFEGFYSIWDHFQGQKHHYNWVYCAPNYDIMTQQYYEAKKYVNIVIPETFKPGAVLETFLKSLSNCVIKQIVF